MLGKRRKNRRYDEFCLFVDRYMLERFEAQAVREAETDAMRRLWEVEQTQMSDVINVLRSTEV